MSAAPRVARWPVWCATAFLGVVVMVAIAAPCIAHRDRAAPIPHAPGQEQFYASFMAPGTPHVRALPTGGSTIAQRLGLTQLTQIDAQRFRSGPVESDALAQPASERSERQSFVLVTASFEHVLVHMDDVADMSAAAGRITEQTHGMIEATFDANTMQFDLVDHTAPAPVHLMGTDRFGADVAANLVHAARTVLLVALVATLIAFVLGVIMGSLMGAIGGVVDFIGLRVIEIFSAVPRLLVLLIVASALAPSMGRFMPMVLMAVIGVTTWMAPARLVRGEILRLREQEFVLAARAVGAPTWRIVLMHLLPIAIVPVLVEATFYMSAAVLLETNLSFLGLGVRPPGASWGGMLADAVDRSTGQLHWWLLAFPGGMIFLTILSIHILGEWWRKRLGVKPSWMRSP